MHEDIFAAWLDGQLTPQQRQEFERLCHEDDVFSERVKCANEAQFSASDFQPVPVPNWDSGQLFTTNERVRWWQWNGFPMVSSAMSLCAILLVLTGFDASFANGQITLTFGGAQQQIEQQVARQVEQKISAYKQEQNAYLTAYAQSMQEQQLDASTQLTNYLLTSSRRERKQDFGELIKFINDQRNEDQIFYARQLNQLQQELSVDASPLPFALPSSNRE